MLFKSGTEHYNKKIIAVLLTGMGADGAKGMLDIKKAGGITICQSKESCVVFGMPKVAVSLGGVNHQIPLEQIYSKISSLLSL